MGILGPIGAMLGFAANSHDAGQARAQQQAIEQLKAQGAGVDIATGQFNLDTARKKQGLVEHLSQDPSLSPQERALLSINPDKGSEYLLNKKMQDQANQAEAQSYVAQAEAEPDARRKQALMQAANMAVRNVPEAAISNTLKMSGLFADPELATMRQLKSNYQKMINDLMMKLLKAGKFEEALGLGMKTAPAAEPEAPADGGVDWAP